MAAVSALNLTLDNGATTTWIHCHTMTTRAALARTNLFAATEGVAWKASASATKEKTRMKNIPEDTASALTLTVRNGKTGRMKGWCVFLMLENEPNEKSPPKECVEAEGGACVANACVMMAGRVRSAPAPWIQPPAWQETACCATVKAHACGEHVNASHHTQVPPVRPAPLAQACLSNTAPVPSARRSGREQPRAGETCSD